MEYCCPVSLHAVSCPMCTDESCVLWVENDVLGMFIALGIIEDQLVLCSVCNRDGTIPFF